MSPGNLLEVIPADLLDTLDNDAKVLDCFIARLMCCQLGS